jgi:hypothetical protein
MQAEADPLAKNALKSFRRRMILTVGEVADLIDSTIHTARRRLKRWGAVNSYNHNGRYYALPDVPQFDPNGLWHYRGVFFSRYGNLKQTVVELVRRSRAGLDAREIRSLLGVEPRSFLSAFASHPHIRREKSRGRFVYYCADPAVHQKQRQRRWALNTKGRLPAPAEAVAILVEKIKRPELSNEALSKRLKKQNLYVPPQIIENFFLRHGLAVKKTPRSV